MNIATTFITDEPPLYGPADALERLREDAKGKRPETLPVRLSVSQITAVPELFQPRAISERHISDLVKAIQNFTDLDPLKVIQVGPRSVLIDGHHRLAAYQQAGRTADIPVEYFEGTLEEAVLEAGLANSKVKLPMTAQERGDYAWRLVLLGGNSKAAIAKAAGVAKSSVATMRKVKAALKEEAYEFTSWQRARMRAQNRGFELTDEEREGWKEALAQKYADRLQRHFASKLSDNPEVTAMALALYFGRRLPNIVHQLHDHVSPEDLVAETEEDWNDDF